MCFFYLIEQHSKFLLDTVQLLYMCTLCDSTGLFKMTVGVLTTCHTLEIGEYVFFFYLIEQHSQVFVTYLTGALYVHTL